MAKGRGGRREPAIDTRLEAGALEIGLSPEDRAGGSMARHRGSHDDGADDPPPRRRVGRRRRGGSLVGRLAYAVLILGLWTFIAVAGVVAYYAAQLPPIDQLAVPKRPPNIAILAADGTLLANRGETGGRTGA